MSHKTLALRTAIIVSLSVTAAVFIMGTYSMLERVNPLAAFAAVTVMVIGLIWLKKTSK